MKVPSSSMPVSMKDQGFYDNHSQTQRAIINMTLLSVKAALSAVPLLGEKQRFVIVDYGCSEGKNSVYMADTVIDIVRQRQQNQSFNVIFNDLPQNNFNKLFENIYEGGLKDNLLSSPQGDTKCGSVLAFASGQPFHLQVVPSDTVNFGYSSSAAHWLTRLPESAEHSHIYVGDAADEEKEKLAEIAAKDWHNFLNLRAIEMAPGARLVVTMAASLTAHKNKNVPLERIGDSDGRIFDSMKCPEEKYSAQIIMNLINDILQELLEEKKISLLQKQNICCPIYSRNIDEVLAPLSQRDLKEKFTVEKTQLVQIVCPFFEKYLQSGDSEIYAQSLTAMFRAFTETFLLNQLGSVSGLAIIDELFDRVQARIKSQPEYYTFFPIHSLLILEKK